MLRKIWTIFSRDLKVNSRDYLAGYILIIPLILAVGINFLVPSVNNTTVNLALVAGDNPAQVAYLENFAKVELLDNKAEVEGRVARRDDVIGILPVDSETDNYYLLQQGNEIAEVVDYARLLLTFYEEDVQLANSNAELYDFGHTVPPMKKMLVNILILLISVMAGMLIAINIVEEKADQTLKAIHLSPVSRLGFLLGKSMMGVFFTVYGTVALLLITGFNNVNWPQMMLFVFLSTLLSILVGFIEGLSNDDVISAAANIKILFLPVVAALVAIEFLNDKWQKFFYWIPFYWSYKGNDAILAGNAPWSQIALYSAIILALSAVVFVKIAPKIRKGLE